ncbi:hypothetical protein M3Y99_00779700 [Aphelenchoides fujianensis]|nr:hypothetical protein M3Y99_00779700 [Aphelenchoides fujianensis]
MGRKKKKAAKPFCWYCTREFEDDKILIQHQKAKHFKCHICNKKLFTGPGLAIHCMQVHKETIDKIPGAIPGRDSVDVEVYGMEGIPQEYDGEPRAKRPAPGPPIGGPMAAPAGIVPPMPAAAYGMQPPAMVGGNPYAAFYGVMPGQFPPLPGGPMPPRFPPMPAASINAPAFPPQAAAASHIPMPSAAAVPPLPSSFAYPAPPTVVSSFDAAPGTSKEAAPPAAAKPLGSKTRIVVPDESISLEEYMAKRIEMMRTGFGR